MACSNQVRRYVMYVAVTIFLVGALAFLIATFVEAILMSIRCDREPISNHTCFALTQYHDPPKLCMSFASVADGQVFHDCVNLDDNNVLWRYQNATWPCYRFDADGPLKISGGVERSGVAQICQIAAGWFLFIISILVMLCAITVAFGCITNRNDYFPLN